MATHTIVYPKPGVTVYLPGGTHGFRSGPVPIRTEHAAELAAHVMTEAEKAAFDAAAAAEATAQTDSRTPPPA